MTKLMDGIMLMRKPKSWEYSRGILRNSWIMRSICLFITGAASALLISNVIQFLLMMGG